METVTVDRLAMSKRSQPCRIEFVVFVRPARANTIAPAEIANPERDQAESLLRATPAACVVASSGVIGFAGPSSPSSTPP
jgi:hypothetical protein